MKLAFEFQVLTATRSGEVRGAVWAEIDRDEGSVDQPGRTHEGEPGVPFHVVTSSVGDPGNAGWPMQSRDEVFDPRPVQVRPLNLIRALVRPVDLFRAQVRIVWPTQPCDEVPNSRSVQALPTGFYGHALCRRAGLT